VRIEFGGPEGGWGAPVRVHDAKTGRLIAALETDDDMNVKSGAFSGDGARVAAGGYGLECGQLIVWSVVSQQRLASLFADENLWAVAMSHDGRVVASGNARGIVELWQAEGGAKIATHRVHEGSIDAMAYAADGRIATASNDDGTIRISRLEGGAQDAPPTHHPDTILDVLFSLDGTRLVTRSENDTTWLWDATTGEPIRCLHASSSRVLEGGTARNAIFAGSQIVSLAHGGAVWDAADGATIVPPSDPQYFWSTRVGLSPDGRTVLLVKLRATEAILAPTLDPGKGRKIASGVRCHAFSADSRSIAVGYEDGNVVLYDGRAPGGIQNYFRAHRGPVSAVALAEGRCASSSEGEPVKVWRLDGWGLETEIRSLAVPDNVRALGFSSSGRVVTVSPEPGPFPRACTVRSWDLESGERVDSVTGILDWRSLLVDRPWRAVIRDKMFVVESAETRQPIAWTPTALTAFTTHPSRPMWAGGVGNQLHWLALEGFP
jgi:WD40 repeat protein